MSLEDLKIEEGMLKAALRKVRREMRASLTPKKPTITKPMRPESVELGKTKAKWRKAVYAMWGRECFFCGQYASDPAHVLKASKLGTAMAYDDPRFCRPTCRSCHTLQEVGLALQFPLTLRQELTHLHNRTARVKLSIPQE